MEADLGYDLFTRSTKDIKITEKEYSFIVMSELVQQYRSTMEKMYDLSVTSEPRIKLGLLNLRINGLRIESTIPTTLNSNIVYMKYMTNTNPWNAY